MMHTLYMEVTADRFELPLAIADSWRELAELRGMTYSGILKAVKSAKKRRFVEVQVNDSEFDENGFLQTCVNWE